jgi:hypothetical protein
MLQTQSRSARLSLVKPIAEKEEIRDGRIQKCSDFAVERALPKHNGPTAF